MIIKLLKEEDTKSTLKSKAYFDKLFKVRSVLYFLLNDLIQITFIFCKNHTTMFVFEKYDDWWEHRTDSVNMDTIYVKQTPYGDRGWHVIKERYIMFDIISDNVMCAVMVDTQDAWFRSVRWFCRTLLMLFMCSIFYMFSNVFQYGRGFTTNLLRLKSRIGTKGQIVRTVRISAIRRYFQAM